MDIKKIIQATNEIEDEVIGIRRKIHKHPELGFQEFETGQLICEILSSWGIEYQYPVAKTGVVAYLRGKKPGKTVLLRADMDALPIQEETGLPFSSEVDGVMHACGHDCHTANLLGVVKILKNQMDGFSGTIKVLFQPAEEAGGGGRTAVNEGVLEDVDMAIGIHVMPEEGGSIKIASGFTTAYSDSFKITIHGENAHTSKPQEGVDAIFVSSKIIDALYSIPVKNIDPLEVATFTIGKIYGGSESNIVPDQVVLEGMMRTLSKKTREVLRMKLEEVTQLQAKVFGAKANFAFHEGYPSVYNDEKMTGRATEFFNKYYFSLVEDIKKGISRETSEKLLETSAKPVLGAEDFGFYAERVPSLFLWVGVGDGPPAHSPKFKIEEKYLKLCTRILASLALIFTNNEGEFE